MSRLLEQMYVLRIIVYKIQGEGSSLGRSGRTSSISMNKVDDRVIVFCRLM